MQKWGNVLNVFCLIIFALIYFSFFYLNRSEGKTPTSDSSRHPLAGPKYYVCIFEHNPRCSPHGVHVSGMAIANAPNIPKVEVQHVDVS